MNVKRYVTLREGGKQALHTTVINSACATPFSTAHTLGLPQRWLQRQSWLMPQSLCRLRNDLNVSSGTLNHIICPYP